MVEHFLDVDRMAARDVVADLMTARMQQFEGWYMDLAHCAAMIHADP